MNNLIGICGYHNSGKTALVEKLIRRLKKEKKEKNGKYCVATVKNIPKQFSIETEGKDTWRHGEAGASVVVAASPNETAFVFKRGMELKEIAAILNATASPDLILVEGHKREAIPKISVGNLGLELEVEGGEGVIKYDGNLDEILNWIKSRVRELRE